MLTDNEIIKALECCTGDFEGCASCPLYDHCCDRGYKLIYYALDLINRQKAEIERLKGLKKHHQELINELNKGIAEAKAEAIKEFAERLKKNKLHVEDEGQIFKMVHCYDIDNLVKEMVGEG